MQAFRLGRLLGLAAVAASSQMAAPAAAQIWIGQIAGEAVSREMEARCMSGVPLPPDEIQEARDPSTAAMRVYWERVSAAAPADVTPAYHARGRADWVLGSQVHGRAHLRQISDPFATQAGATFNPAPIAFVRSGSGHTARGLWSITNGDGAVSGHYLADFGRRSGAWKLQRLELLTGNLPPPAVAQYCHEPHDVERARAEAEERRIRREARRAAREAAQTTRR